MKQQLASHKLSTFFIAFLALFLAAQVCAAQGGSVTSPESAFGYRIGSDFKLADYDESIRYFQRLDSESDRIRVFKAGTTSEGRDWYYAIISSPENLANIEKLREISLRLSHPQGLTDEAARQLALDGKAFVHIDGGLHASEVAGAQHTIQLAHNLVAGSSQMVQSILDNVVLFLWPSANPDGQNIVVNWYRSNLGTPYEISPLPRLYQKYVGHDNNRDAYMLNMIESRVSARMWRHWEPQVIYVHHQTSPFPTRIWLPPFAEPIGSQAPALMSRTVNTMGMAIAQMLEARGQIGATHMGKGFDAWYPGYIDYLPMFQNIAAFWTETGLYRYATPHFYTVNDFPRNFRDLRAQTLYPSPWKGGWWRVGDAVEYMVTASEAVLDYAAKYKSDLLYNRYQTGRNAIRRYANEPPYAYFIPQDQHDKMAPVELLRRLAFNGLQVYQLTEATTHEAVSYPAGTWVIPMDQVFSELARQVLDVQTYPDLREFPEGPLEQPYDAAGWTLPFQMGVRVIAASMPLENEVRSAMVEVKGEAIEWQPEGTKTDSSPFDSVSGVGFDTNATAAGIVSRGGQITGSGPNLKLDTAQNNSFKVITAALRSGNTVSFGSVQPDNTDGEKPHYVVSGVDPSQLKDWVDRFALDAERTDNASGPKVRLRLGVYHAWRPSMEEGWCRWLLEQYGFDFTRLTNAGVIAGSLAKDYDVILIASQRPATILDGFAKGSVPPRYQGGLGVQGVRALDQFVRSGGTLVCLNQATGFAIEQLNLPVKNVVEGLERSKFYTGGSILDVTVDIAHPVMTGMPERSRVFVERSPAFTTLDGFQGKVMAKYEPFGPLLASGYLVGAEYLHGHAAAVDVRHGEGNVILIGFNPTWRGQPFGTFRVLFNSVLYGSDVAGEDHGTPGFWSPPVAKKPEVPPEKQDKEGQPPQRMPS